MIKSLVCLLLVSPLTFAAEFKITSAAGHDRVSFTETGDVYIAVGEILEGSDAVLSLDPEKPEFAIKNAAGAVVLRVPEDVGGLNVAGTIQYQQAAPLVPPSQSFIIKRADGQIVTYVDSLGNLVTLGKIFRHGIPVDRVTGGGAWGGHPSDVAFSNFSNIGGIITLSGDAFVDGPNLVTNDTKGSLIHTPPDNMSITDVQVGAAWLNQTVPLDKGFQIDLNFTIHHGTSTQGSTGQPVDFSRSGFALVFQNQSANPTLHSGLHQDCGPDPNTADCEGEMGYSGITNAVAIEFDSEMESSVRETDNPHTISVQACSPLTRDHDDCSVASVLLPCDSAISPNDPCTPEYVLANGSDFQRLDNQGELVPRLKGTHKATITYDPSKTLQVYMDDQFALSVQNFDLPQMVSGTSAWVGMVGASPPEPSAQRVELHDFRFTVDRPYVIGLSGEQLSGSDPNKSGIRDWVDCFDEAYYDVHFYDEDAVDELGDGLAWEELNQRLAWQKRVRLAFVGHSHGGGSVFSLAGKLAFEYPQFPPGLQLIFTGYVDAIDNANDATMVGETRRPTNSLYHLNLYQTVSFIHGAANVDDTAEWDVNSLACVTNVDHGRIDNCGVVHRLLSSHLQFTAFGDPVLSPLQICTEPGVSCSPTTGDYSCIP